jgi:hypothetical protein
LRHDDRELRAAEEEEKEEGQEVRTRRLVATVLCLLLAAGLTAGPAVAKKKRPAVRTQTFSSGDINVPLPAGAATGLNVFKQTLKSQGKITDVNVSIRLTNANPNGDFKHLISLRGPNSGYVGLAGERAGAGYGAGPSSCASSPTIFDDEAPVAWADPGAVAPFVGPHRPSEPLTAFDGASPQGTWDLLITSNYGSFGAPVLNCWQLTITYKAKKKKRRKK